MTSNTRPTPRPWSESWESVIASLGVGIDDGLRPDEVNRRRKLYGSNRLRQQARRSTLSILGAQFKSLIIGLLLAAAAVGFAFGEILAGWAVVVVIALNTAIGFFTELRAVRSMEALHALSNVRTRVRRSGQVCEIAATELVPGDVVVFEGGDMIAADLRIAEASRLQVDESTLTGESLPVNKSGEPLAADTPLADRSSMLYKGTAVTRGAGTGIVVAIGMETELGGISALVAAADKESTPLEKRLDQLGRRLIWVTLVVTALVTLFGTVAGRDFLLMVQTGLALAVAAIPEGLPIVATIALARGMQRMARRHALINRLSSVETLGATGIICTDKTGTLTENRMTVSSIVLQTGLIEFRPDADESFLQEDAPVYPASNALLRAGLETAVLCNDATLGEAQEGKFPDAVGDPLEVALLRAGAAAGLRRPDILESQPEVREEAFDSDVRMMATFHRAENMFRLAVKGAPEAVLEASTQVLTANGPESMDDSVRASWMSQNEELAAEGQRVIAVATRNVDNTEGTPYADLSFIGLIGLEDPPRKDVREAIEQCRHAGIEVIMVTGDQAVTALTVACELGLVESRNAPIIHGSEMKPAEQMSQDEREQHLKTRLFARVSPKQKLDLIELHQKAGHIVAMTGDGINDAPALEKADIGIAMGLRGTQVAREAADMVLQDDAFPSIVAAVREGRAIFTNIRTFVLYLMSCNVSEVMVVGLAASIGSTLPILPLQILFLNLVTDVFPALALGVSQGEKDIMEKPPRDPKEPILGRQRWLRIAAYGAVFTVSVLGALILAERWLGMDSSHAVTVSFLTLAYAQLWHVFNMRDDQANIFRNEITRNPWVWAALTLCSGLILLALYVPLFASVLGLRPPGMAGWGIAISMSLLPLFFGQLMKKAISSRTQPSPGAL